MGLARFAFSTVIGWSKRRPSFMKQDDITEKGYDVSTKRLLLMMFRVELLPTSQTKRLIKALVARKEVIKRNAVRRRCINKKSCQSRKALQNFTKLPWNRFYLSYLHTPACAHRHVDKIKRDWVHASQDLTLADRKAVKFFTHEFDAIFIPPFDGESKNERNHTTKLERYTIDYVNV
ncbi:hypothetical protein G9A89_022979 [Geosiphon pyriformis]|nr:hypothetical protein G9A89_022979 [Geosiphon pyriformis]